MEQGGFDLRELIALYEGDTESLREILDLFEQDAPPRRLALEAALEAEEKEAAITAAHSLANLLGAIRNRAGAEAARRCEKAVRASDFEAAKLEKESVDRAVEESLEAIDAFG